MTFSTEYKIQKLERIIFWLRLIQGVMIIVHGYPHTRDDTNSIIFPWNGYTSNGGWFEIKLEGVLA